MIWTLVIGFVIGLLARALMPGKDPAGFIVTTLLGIAGSFVARLAGQAVGFYGPDEPAGLVMSVLGALVVLGLYGKFMSRGSTTAA